MSLCVSVEMASADSIGADGAAAAAGGGSVRTLSTLRLSMIAWHSAEFAMSSHDVRGGQIVGDAVVGDAVFSEAEKVESLVTAPCFDCL